MPFITPLPTPPSREDPPDVFVARANAFVASLVQFVDETNALAASLTIDGVAYLVYEAANNVTSHRVVRACFNSKVKHADASTIADANSVIGIAVNTATTGQDVQIQILGEIEDLSWTWAEDLPIFCGADGVLTQTPPTSGFQLIVGIPVAPTKLIVNLKQPIILA